MSRSIWVWPVGARVDLDRIAVRTRPRGAWEGLDLGFAMARTWFLPLWRLWWWTALPTAVICLFLTGFRADLWLLALWWLKPLNEGPLLLWASRALFGESLGWRRFPETWRAGWPRRLWPYLLWRRIGMRRSFLMPLTLLEGLSGQAARERRRVMNDGGGVPFWLTLVGYHFEVILWMSLLLAVFFLVPAELPRLDLVSAVTGEGSWASWVGVLAYLLVFSVIAPFYVCAGFALYLTRRTDLEAWDLELAFREARDRRSEPAGLEPKGRFLGLLAAIAILPLVVPPDVQARPHPSLDPDQARALIQDVLAGPDFGSTMETAYWAPIERGDEPAEDSPVLPAGLPSFLRLSARVLKWLLLVGAVGVVVWLSLRMSRDWRPWRGRRARPDRRPPSPARALETSAHGIELAEVPTAVRACLQAEDRRGALALLYRASLTHLETLGPPVPDGATEGECLAAAVRNLPRSALGPLEPLTRAWQRLAYAHQEPSLELLEALLLAWCRWTQDAGASAP
ncbi:DUF4129 domain-containing protein [Thiocystis violacea]|uniref:DUF4129 domain-containing protein n=1 Tax=Thiocystis violacea TaxID=13725 RepID=UPI001908B96F|nr:DUF4129 domain-containing protein [Thiocystis violacea]